MKNSIFINVFCDDYDRLLFSVKAFLPSLRVLKTNQERDEAIMMVSVNSEKKVVSILLFNLFYLAKFEYYS